MYASGRQRIIVTLIAMKTHIFTTILLLSALTATAAPKKFASKVIAKETPGHQVAVEIDITGATQLFLEVTDGGDGSGYDWADWIEPRLITADGKEKRLTELEP
ncbi:MAG: hypothetical protein ACI9MB_004880, partial [Verrucomicrobiales bacterium]